MKKLIGKVTGIYVVVVAFVANMFNNTMAALSRPRAILAENRAEGFVDTAVKILIAIVIGALILGGLYLLFSGTILPELTRRIQDMFNFSG